MRPRCGLALLLTLLAPAAIAGCGSEAPGAERTTPPPGYVDAAQDLFQPVGLLASAVAARAEAPGAPAPDRASLDEIVDEADTALVRFRALPVDDAGLRSQQRRLVEGYETVRGRMDAVVDSLAAGDPPADLAQASEGFFDSLDTLAALAGDTP